MRGWSLLLCVALLGAAVSIGQSKQDKDKITDPRLKAILETFRHQDTQIENAAAKADAAVKAVEALQKQFTLTEAEVKKFGTLGRDVVAAKAEIADLRKAQAELRAALPKLTEDQAKSDVAIKQLRERLAKLEASLRLAETSVAEKRVEKILASIPQPYRDYLKERPAWLTADQSADLVYVAGQRKLLVLAVGSSPLNKKYPRDACELQALAATKAACESKLVAQRKLEPDGNVTKVISQFVEGGVKGLPVVGEWLSPDGQRVYVLYGNLTEVGR